MLRLTRLNLTEFRNYARLSWIPGARISVITGPNGSGKTNLLEAVSLLAPGRGFARGRMADLARAGGPGSWAVAARLTLDGAPHELGTGTTHPATDRRAFRLDGEEPRSQADVAALFSAIWLTPQMDTLFQESASGRRRFLDRLVWALEPGHAREASAHEAAMAERRRLLALHRPDPAWLAAIEDAIARHSVALAAARAAYAARLNAAHPASSQFPPTRLELNDPVATRLQTTPALAVEDWLRGELAARRPRDAEARTSTLGAHRADMQLHDAATRLPAATASTGQQKTMLIATILAHAALIAEARQTAPLLLLDEPAVHLDATRRAALWEALRALPAQCLLTGTDRDVFAGLGQDAEFLATGEDRLR